MNKTVYVLGAGFSMDFGAPSQAEITSEIFELRKSYDRSVKPMIHSWIDKFETFLKESLIISDSEKIYYTLEDIYTPIDKSILEGIAFRDYTPKDLIELREIFNKLIILAVREAIEKKRKSRKSVEKFANHIVNLSKSRLLDEKNDRVSIITTNWDIMLDNIANNIIAEDMEVKKNKTLGVIDYCCHISSLDENDHKIKPGLYAIGQGGYNLKILKLHGSLNWLQCPKCQRLYVKYFKRWSGGYVFDKKYCRHCERNFSQKKHKSNQLSTNLIMPTFLKNFNNIQNKLIWQNAAIELSEASKVVFIGYSLPQADFEFKQLLSRMIRNDAEIEVVLIDKDDPSKYIDSSKYLTAGYRFSNFFSGRRLTLSYDGVATYIDANCS